MASRYQSISYAEFRSWMDKIGFTQVTLPGVFEYAFERVVNCKATQDRPDRFKIQIMSSVDVNTNVTREVGGDAIRVLLLDTKPVPVAGRRWQEKIVADWTVYRTAGAHQNVVQRARDAWSYVSQHPEHHCSCGSLMVERKGKGGTFLGCTSYPECKETKQIGEKVVTITARLPATTESGHTKQPERSFNGMVEARTWAEAQGCDFYTLHAADGRGIAGYRRTNGRWHKMQD